MILCGILPATEDVSMMRCARVATLCLVGILCAGAVSAQPATAASDSRFYLELTAGPTLGHKSDKSVGVEAGMTVGEHLEGFLEGGHIGNAATSDFEARGQKIANALGATLSSVEKVNYFDVGVRYLVPVMSSVHPYIAVGVGIAHVTTETNLTIGGAPVNPDSVSLGTDLAGTFTRPLIMFGVGANITFATRFFGDLSYRYGRVSGESDASEVVLAAVPTQRLQFGIGVRF
jgi:opacity protein-like surface antigen